MNYLKIFYLRFMTILMLKFDGHSFIMYKHDSFGRKRFITMLRNQNHDKEVENLMLLSPEDHHRKDSKKSSSFNTQKQAERRNFPFSMIVNQDHIKQALLLLATNPKGIGGVLISGRHGTGKSILAKAIHNILPQSIKCVKGSPYNIDHEGRFGVDSFLQIRLESKGISLKDLETVEIATPFVQIPLNVMEDSLVGTIDLEKSVLVGENVFLPGLLAKAHRGLVYIDDINLLDDNIVDILFDIVSEGVVKVEREGLSVQYPCRPLIVATYNEQEGEIREHLKDRIAISLSADLIPMSISDRVKVVDNFITFSGDLVEREKPESSGKLKNAENDDDFLRSKIVSARKMIENLQLSHKQMLFLCEEATRAGCMGQRAEIFAVEVAKAHAAFIGRNKVNADDLRTAVKLVITPRSRFVNNEESFEPEGEIRDSSEQQDSELNPLAPDDLLQDEIMQDNVVQESREEIENVEDVEEIDSQQEALEEQVEIPTEFMFGVTGVPIDPEIMKFAHLTKKGKGGKSSRMFNFVRGRYVKPIFPLPGQKGRLAVGATLRAAAPYQIFRRASAQTSIRKRKAVFVEKSDFRVKQMKRKAGALVVFVVDASGSMALNRMDAAKGSAIALLSEAYKARDKISLVVFRGDKAEVIVPPTKSIALTKARLESMPCGGGSPLAHALVVATKVGVNECTIKKDVGRLVMVIISDGRANVPLCISEGERWDPTLMPSIDGKPSKQFLRDEVLSCARTVQRIDCQSIVIDTEDKFVSTGIARDIAAAAGANYYCIDARDTSSIQAVTKNI